MSKAFQLRHKIDIYLTEDKRAVTPLLALNELVSTNIAILAKTVSCCYMGERTEVPFPHVNW